MKKLDIQKIRSDFPILSRKVNGNKLVYLDNAATTQKPNSVIDSISNFYKTSNSNVHRGVHTLSIESTENYEFAREKIAKLINSPSPETVIWTRNTSESINLVAFTWGEKNIMSGDNIVITPMEHHSNIVPWQQIAKKKNAEIRYLPMSNDGKIEFNNIGKIIDSKTKIVALTHVSNVLGTINPAKKIIDIAHDKNAVVLLDAAQSVPHMPVDVSDLDVDFLTFSLHKMMGPTGIGILYGRKQLLDEMPPYMFGGDMILEVSYEKDAKWNSLPYKFEAGTPNFADAIASGVAVDYLNQIGIDNIWQHEKLITEYAMSKMLSLKKIHILGSPDFKDRGGVISFYHEDIHPHDLGTALDQRGIAIRTGHHCAMPLVRSYDIVAAARISFYVYNTIDEVDAFLYSLEQIEGYFTK
ncbi:MAG: cysteine desulfurase [Chloroflexi bacterium]|nr:cysteine desulfurase [Chloroflexota bacterium]